MKIKLNNTYKNKKQNKENYKKYKIKLIIIKINSKYLKFLIIRKE